MVIAHARRRSVEVDPSCEVGGLEERGEAVRKVTGAAVNDIFGDVDIVTEDSLAACGTCGYECVH
jgi:uncharacterized protein YbcI